MKEIASFGIYFTMCFSLLPLPIVVDVNYTVWSNSQSWQAPHVSVKTVETSLGGEVQGQRHCWGFFYHMCKIEKWLTMFIRRSKYVESLFRQTG